MTRVAAIGAPGELAGWALAGAEVIEATDDEGVRRAWSELAPDIGLVVLTFAARKGLPPRLDGRVLWAVLPR